MTPFSLTIIARNSAFPRLADDRTLALLVALNRLKAAPKYRAPGWVED